MQGHSLAEVSLYFRILIFELSVSVAARSKAKARGCSHGEIVG